MRTKTLFLLCKRKPELPRKFGVATEIGLENPKDHRVSLVLDTVQLLLPS